MFCMYYKQGKAMVVFDHFFERLNFKCKVMHEVMDFTKIKAYATWHWHGLNLVKDMLKGINERKNVFHITFMILKGYMLGIGGGEDGTPFKNKMPIEPNNFF